MKVYAVVKEPWYNSYYGMSELLFVFKDKTKADTYAYNINAVRDRYDGDGEATVVEVDFE